MGRREHQLFDSHVHLDRLPAEWSLSRALETARSGGIEGWLVPGVRRPDWQGLLALAEQHRNVWAAPGLHPLAADQWTPDARAELEGLLAHGRVVAIGEIGLDRVIEVPFAQQERAFCEQLELARAHELPVLIHCRNAWGRLLDILEERKPAAGGILHAFGGSLESAQRGIALGFAVGIGGTLTYPDARKRVAVLQGLPEEMIVLETDAPDLPPHPHRGESNRPEWLRLIAARVAELRGWTPQQTARITTANCHRILGRRLEEEP